MKDFREKWLLKQGDTIEANGYVYTITGEPLGYGGSAVLYQVERTDSELSFAVKECFPNIPGRFIRKDGIVNVITEDDMEGKELLAFYRRMFETERRAGQNIRNSTGRIIGIWENLPVKTVTTEGKKYDADEGIYALLERMDGKGHSLSEILKDCREDVSTLYPLRTGGLPGIYTSACIMEQILRALRGVHESGYLFGDVQVNNIFFVDCRLGEENIGFGCLFDFGSARPLLEDGYTEEITDCKIFSTEGYIPPEVLYRNNGHLRLGKQADVYSAGKLMLLNLLTEGKDLTEASMSIKRLLQAYHGKKINCGGKALELVNRILEKSLQPEPENRYRDAEAMLEDILSLKKLTEPPKYRLASNMSSPDYFVPGSRDREIEALKKSMQQGEYPMLWGYGGMGKTETAIELAKRMDTGKGAYLVHFKESMRETILSLHFSGYIHQPDRKLSPEEQQEQEYREKMSLLKEYYEGSILIIDNFDNEEKTLDEMRREKEFIELAGLGVRLIFTTRYPVGRKEWEIAELDREALLNVMKFHLKSVPVPSDEKLYEMIDAVGSHTLTVSLMAKTLEESWGMVTPDEILEALKNSSISEENFPEIVSDQNRTYRQEQIYQHLKVLFNLSGMSEKERKVLSCAVLLPQGGMDTLLFMECLEKEEQVSLRKLVAKGWLRRQEGNLLTIHPIICQVCREELKTEAQICKGFLNNLHNIFNRNEFSFVRYSQMAECFRKATEYLEDKDGHYSLIAGYIYNRVSDVKKSLEYLEKGVRIKEVSLYVNNRNWYHSFKLIKEAYMILGEYDKAVKLCEHGIVFLSSNHLELASLYSYMGRIYNRTGGYAEALMCHQKALRLRQENLPSDHSDLAFLYNEIGNIYGKLRKYEIQLKQYNTALNIWEKRLSANHPFVATAYNNVGTAYRNLGEYKKSLEYYQKSLEIMEEIYPANHLSIAGVYINIGGAYCRLGDYEKGLKYGLKALEIQEKGLPSNHLELAGAYDLVGAAYSGLEKYRNSQLWYYKALKVRQENLSSNHPDLASSCIQMGYIWGKLGEYKGQLEITQVALRIYEKSLPSNHPDLQIAYNNVGRAYENLQNYNKSLEYFQKSMEIVKEIYPANHKRVVDAYINIGNVCRKLGEYETALEFYRKVLKIWETDNTITQSSLANLYKSIAITYGRLGQVEEAQKYGQKAQKISEEI